MHICTSPGASVDQVMIDSANGLSSVELQAITKTVSYSLPIGYLRTKQHLTKKMSSANGSHFVQALNVLTYWDWNKMAIILQTTLSNAFSWKKMVEFQADHWWGDKLLSESMMVRCIHVLLSLNELTYHTAIHSSLPWPAPRNFIKCTYLYFVSPTSCFFFQAWWVKHQHVCLTDYIFPLWRAIELILSVDRLL